MWLMTKWYNWHMFKKRSLTIFLLVAFLLITVLGVAYLFGARHPLISDTGSQGINPNPSVNQVNQFDSKNWKMYRDDTLGITFQYPNTMEITTESGSPSYLVVTQNLNAEETTAYGIRIGIVESTKRVTFKTYVQNNYTAATHSSNNKCDPSSINTALSETTLANKNAYVYQQLNCFNTDTTIYSVLNNDKIYYAAAYAAGENRKLNMIISKKILDSVRFL